MQGHESMAGRLISTGIRNACLGELRDQRLVDMYLSDIQRWMDQIGLTEYSRISREGRFFVYTCT